MPEPLPTKQQTPARRGAMLAAIWTLAWPTMLEQWMQTAVQYIDTAMVGSLGTRATAAVGATATVNWLVGTTISAIGVGFLAYIAQAIGAGEAARARRASSQAVLAALLCGSVFTALPLALSRQIPVWMRVDPEVRDLAARYFFILYTPMLFRAATILFGTVLRAAGDTKTPMRVGVWVNLINITLNFLLIYPTRQLTLGALVLTVPGAGWGVEGAAAASAVAYAAGGVLITRTFWRHPAVSPKGQPFRPDWQVLRPCLRVAFPNALQRFGISLGYVAFASMVNSLGGAATAAHTIANTVESAFYVPAYGMQTAAATLAGNAYGARDDVRLRALARTVLALEVCLMTVTGSLLFAFAPALMRIFSRDAQVIALGVRVLRMVAVSEPFYGVAVIIEGLLQGMGRTVLPFVCSVTGMWGIRIAGTWVCTQRLGMGLASAWGCMITHNLALFLVFGTFYVTGIWDPMRKKA